MFLSYIRRRVIFTDIKHYTTNHSTLMSRSARTQARAARPDAAEQTRGEARQRTLRHMNALTRRLVWSAFLTASATTATCGGSCRNRYCFVSSSASPSHPFPKVTPSRTLCRSLMSDAMTSMVSDHEVGARVVGLGPSVIEWLGSTVGITARRQPRLGPLSTHRRMGMPVEDGRLANTAMS